jgi:hypothetical protein
MQTLAFATNCQHDQFDRPTVGYTGICFGPLVRVSGGSFFFVLDFVLRVFSLCRVGNGRGAGGGWGLELGSFDGESEAKALGERRGMKTEARVGPLEWVEECIVEMS